MKGNSKNIDIASADVILVQLSGDHFVVKHAMSGYVFGVYTVNKDYMNMIRMGIEIKSIDVDFYMTIEDYKKLYN